MLYNHRLHNIENTVRIILCRRCFKYYADGDVVWEMKIAKNSFF